MTADLTIHIDLSGIEGFLALAPTFDLIDDVGIHVEWLPLTGILKRLSSQQPHAASDDPLVIYKARRAKARHEFEQRELARNCERLGISSQLASKQFDPTLAHVGLLYLNELKVELRGYLFACYQAVYCEGKTLQSTGDIAALISSLGFDGSGYKDYQAQGELALESLQTRLLEQGVFDSPAYLLNGERFHGRQHLPLIRWTLTGCQGQAPV